MVSSFLRLRPNHIEALQNTDILLKDSIYGAIGLSAAVLAGKLDFNSFMISTLVPEIQNKQEGYEILRRRAAIMLGQWVPVDADNLDTAVVYQIFQLLLSSSDLVVRVTAGRQLKHAIDPYSNPTAKLDPHVPQIFERLLALIDEVEFAETKMALLNTVQTLVQFMGEGVTVHEDQVISRLPPIWEAAGDEYILKQNILGLVSELFKAMKGSSIKYHPLILPLISSALDLANEDRMNLLDDAVDLWTAVLTQVRCVHCTSIRLTDYLADAGSHTRCRQPVASSIPTVRDRRRQSEERFQHHQQLHFTRTPGHARRSSIRDFQGIDNTPGAASEQGCKEFHLRRDRAVSDCLTERGRQGRAGACRECC